MARRKLTREVIVVLVVSLAALIYLLVQRNDHTQYRVPVLVTLDQKGLSKILIEKSDETVELVNRDGAWIIAPNQYQTDKEKVQKAIDAVANLKLAELISRSGNDAMYDLNPDKRIRVSLFKGSEMIRQIDFGKVAGTYRHTFVRLQNQNEVYQASGSLRSDLDLKSDDFRDKMVLKIDSNEVTRIKLSNAGQNFEFSKTVSTAQPATAAAPAGQPAPAPAEIVNWNSVPERKEAVKKEALDDLLAKLQDLRCDRFAAADTTVGEVMFELTVQAAAAHTLTFFKPASDEATEILARSSQSPYLFYLSKWSADGIKKNEADLFVIPQADPAK